MEIVEGELGEKGRHTTWGKQSLTKPKISGGCRCLNQGSR